MYSQLPDQLNAQMNVSTLWSALPKRLSRLIRFVVQHNRLRKSERLLAELDGRLLRDIGMPDAPSRQANGLTSQDPRVLAFSMQMLRAP